MNLKTNEIRKRLVIYSLVGQHAGKCYVSVEYESKKHNYTCLIAAVLLL